MKASSNTAVLEEIPVQTKAETLLVGLDLGTNTSALLASPSKSADIVVRELEGVAVPDRHPGHRAVEHAVARGVEGGAGR